MNALAAYVFAVSIAYWPLASSSTTVGRWAVAAIGGALLLALAQSLPRPSFGHWAALLFLAWSAASLLWSVSPLDTAGTLMQLAVVGMAFMLGTAAPNLRGAFIGLGLGVSVSAGFAVLQFLDYAPVDGFGTAGLFLNKSMLAEVGCVALVGALAYRLWVFVPGAMVATALPMAREALVMLAAAGAVYLWRWSRVAVVGLGAVIFAALVADLMLPHRISSLGLRTEIWSETISNLSLLGSGLGTYALLWPNYEFAHNDFLQAAFEVGIGASLLTVVVAHGLAAPRTNVPEKAAMAALLAASAVSFPFHVPTTAILFGLVAGRLCGARDRAIAAEPSRRVLDPIRTDYAWPVGIGAPCTSDLGRAGLAIRSQYPHRA